MCFRIQPRQRPTHRPKPYQVYWVDAWDAEEGEPVSSAQLVEQFWSERQAQEHFQKAAQYMAEQRLEGELVLLGEIDSVTRRSKVLDRYVPVEAPVYVS